MSLMNMFAIEATAANTTNNPVPTNPVLDTVLDTDTSLDAIMASIVIEFDSADECEAIVVEKNGVEYRYMRNQQKYVQVTVDPRRRGSWRWFSAECTLVYFVKNDNLIGQTAILPVIDSLSTARALTARCIEVCNDVVKVMNWKF